MIQNPYGSNFKAQDSSKATVPAGCYVAKVIKVDTADLGGRPRLNIYVDIIEGEYKGAYMKRFDSDKSSGRFTPKYKGVFSLNLPCTDDRYPASTQRELERMAYALEQSNEGYHWDWDEQRLRGLLVGICVRDEEYLMERQGEYVEGVTQRIFRLCTVAQVRDGSIPTPAPKKLSEEKRAKILQQSSPVSGAATVANDDDIPF